jgi:2,5-diketo-D-gluconate reductase A
MITLRNGVRMPQLGLGTWQLKGDECIASVVAALKAGYRHIDTASVYRNEEAVAAGIAAAGLDRSEVFITSKLQPRDQGSKAYEAALASLERLGTSYFDLYLIHWPGVQGKQPNDTAQKAIRAESWAALERLYEEGKAKAIGVSNYMPWHIEELMAIAKVPPALNQFELHACLQQRAVREACSKHGIAVESYSTLARGAPELLESAVVKAAAEAHGKTPAQIALRWAVQQGIVVIPRSTKEVRIVENSAIFDFELTNEEMEAMNGLERGLRTCWDPETIVV